MHLCKGRIPGLRHQSPSPKSAAGWTLLDSSLQLLPYHGCHENSLPPPHQSLTWLACSLAEKESVRVGLGSGSGKRGGVPSFHRGPLPPSRSHSGISRTSIGSRCQQIKTSLPAAGLPSELTESPVPLRNRGCGTRVPEPGQASSPFPTDIMKPLAAHGYRKGGKQINITRIFSVPQIGHFLFSKYDNNASGRGCKAVS